MEILYLFNVVTILLAAILVWNTRKPPTIYMEIRLSEVDENVEGEEWKRGLE